MQLHPLKLVTVVTEQVLREQIVAKAQQLGARGCTWQEVQGTGSRGARSHGVSGTNVQIEIICSTQTAEALLQYVAHQFFDFYACIAWITDVSVVRGARYVGQ